MTHREKYRLFLKILFSGSLVFFLLFLKFYFSVMIPDHVLISVEQETPWCVQIPLFDGTISTDSEEVVLLDTSNIPADKVHIQSRDVVRIQAGEKGVYSLEYKLFGWLPVQKVDVEVIEPRNVTPCGTSVGIYLKTDGILIIGTSEIENAQGIKENPAENVVQSGDYIVAVNEQEVETKEMLSQLIQESQGEDLCLSVRRNGEIFPVRIKPVMTQTGEYRLGIWVRDDTQGIGTLTYMDDEGNFGALGHGISDTDTREVVEVQEGGLYSTSIKGITKGTDGNPGTLSGIICYGEDYYLGEIEKNCQCGIFGRLTETCQKSIQGDVYPVGYSQEVHTGEAQILSNISGSPVYYKIEIERINRFSTDNKEMVLKITDQDLLELTGGIVQGMSGSPIIQDGKLVGAVTHVFVNDPARGYGIFVENMMKQ